MLAYIDKLITVSDVEKSFYVKGLNWIRLEIYKLMLAIRGVS